MKSKFNVTCGFLIALAAILTIPLAFAQTGPGKGQGMGQGMGIANYDPSSVTTVRGAVLEVQEGAMQSGQKGEMKGMGHMGTHLVVKTDKESLTVLVGPSSFLQEKNFSFAKGDQIEVTGSKVKYGDSDAIIAREIKKGDKVLMLRNEKGVPEWSMGRQR